MSKRQKCMYEDRLQAVEDYLSGRKNQKQIAADLGLGKRGRSTVGLWIRKYQEAGPESLKSSVRNRVYSKEFKEQVVQEYLDGKLSMEALAIKYGIPNHGSVQEWISMYNSHRKLKATPVAKGVPMGASKRKIPQYGVPGTGNGTVHVKDRKLHRQWSHGRVLGHCKDRMFLQQEVQQYERVDQNDGGIHPLLQL